MSLITGALTLPKQAPNGVPVAAYLAVCINAAGQLVLVDESGGLAALGITAGKTVTFPQSLAFPSGAGTTGQQLTTDGAGALSWAAPGVTSVAASVPAFLSISGSPITSSGTLAITLSGTALPVANGGTGITTFGTGVATALGLNTLAAGGIALAGTGTNAALNATTFGATTAGSGAFTTLSASGITNFTNSTQATFSNAASVVLAGGLGVAKDFYLAGNLYCSATSTCATHSASSGAGGSLTYPAFATWGGSSIGLISTSYYNITFVLRNTAGSTGFSAGDFTTTDGTAANTTFSLPGKLAVTGAGAFTGLISCAGGVKHTGTTIAALPASPAAGTMASITDGDAALGWGATPINSGGGATKYLVWYNGTNWTIAGK